jgi:tetratricopeptide (TPR) repeat protein
LREQAWVSLQRGLLALQANNLERALAHYREASELLPGWWLADEHIAETLALHGHDERALTIYHDVLARTGDPEFMDAIARIHRDRGDETVAQQWIARAKRGHAGRLARFPEAAAEHAAQHIRDFGEITKSR